MAYRIGRQKEENKGLLRGNVIRTQLNNIMSYKCSIYRAITYFLFTPLLPFNHMYQFSHKECFFFYLFHQFFFFMRLNITNLEYFEIRPLVVLHSLGGVYCVEEMGVSWMEW